MKKFFTFFKSFLAAICFLGSFFFSSCDSFHFSNPLPVDSKNIYTVPRPFRGIVREKEDRKPSEYVLEKNAIVIRDPDTLKIINGIWFHPADTFRAAKSDTTAWKRIMDMPVQPSIFEVEFDSLGQPIDTIRNFILHQGKIYRVLPGKLENGMEYTMKNDTICVHPGIHRTILGQNAFLRKVNSDMYLINRNIIDDEHVDWWVILLAVKGKNGQITFYDWGEEIKSDPTMIFQRGHDYYLDSHWTREDIEILFKQGKFKDTGLVIFPE